MILTFEWIVARGLCLVVGVVVCDGEMIILNKFVLVIVFEHL